MYVYTYILKNNPKLLKYLVYDCKIKSFDRCPDVPGLPVRILPDYRPDAFGFTVRINRNTHEDEYSQIAPYED